MLFDFPIHLAHVQRLRGLADKKHSYYKVIFEEQLSGWWRDETDWPTKRDMKTFTHWFDVEFHSVVLDVVQKPLLGEK